MKLLAILLSVALLLGGCATAPETAETPAAQAPPWWMLALLGVIALLVGVGLARLTPLDRGA